MRRADRLFDIIQVLRLARGPITAAAIATELEVTPRTVYRDIATLQARRVPIEGAAGLGYILRRGYDLPPLMFTEEEAEAIAVGLRLLRRTGDPSLASAARSVLSKLGTVLPEGLRTHLAGAPFLVSGHGAPAPIAIALSDVRAAIRNARKLRLDYVDANGATTVRTVLPIAVEYYVEATLLCAWCELRADYRHFRADRIAAATVLDAGFAPDAARLTAGWRALTETP
ncbi:MAG: YafY family transcriptional regulator [Proteobacteria bacterium]|nr:YafY family transcriptional regulator [Pseudomonadota bacterium]